jgi:membrane protease YdiL (CAAX protease family)
VKLTRGRVLGLYVLASYALAWTPALYMAMAGHSWASPHGRAAAVLLSFAPLIAALWVQGPLLKQPVLEPLGLNIGVNRWWLASWLLAPALLFLAMLFCALLGAEPTLTAADYVANKRSLVDPAGLAAFDAHLRESPPSSPLWLILMGMPAGLTINLLPALGEEIAYRGLLFREMPGSYFKRSVLIGLVWAGTLMPAVLQGHLYPAADPRLGGLLWLAYCLTMSLVLVYFRVRSGSTVAVGIARGTIMALTLVAVDLTFGAGPLVRPFFGLTGVLAAVVVLALCYVHDRYVATERLMTWRA